MSDASSEEAIALEILSGRVLHALCHHPSSEDHQGQAPGRHLLVGRQTSDQRSFGEWLYAPAGSAWEAPHDAGQLDFDVMVLVRPDQWVVGWWIDQPGDRSVAADICLPPESTPGGWSFVDLELDAVRHGSGLVEIEDEDEFAVACQEGWISTEEAEVAVATAARMQTSLRDHEEPWGEIGWQRLSEARDSAYPAR